MKKSKLVDKDWYFDGTEGDTVDKANAKARQWELICPNWEAIMSCSGAADNPLAMSLSYVDVRGHAVSTD